MTTNTTTTNGIISWGRLSDRQWRMSPMEVRKPGDHELQVEMVASGVCHTDLLIGNLPEGASPVGFYPRVLGHEGSFGSLSSKTYADRTNRKCYCEGSRPQRYHRTSWGSSLALLRILRQLSTMFARTPLTLHAVQRDQLWPTRQHIRGSFCWNG